MQMGRRYGNVTKKICLRASKEMAALRRMQTQINNFLWTSEISAFHALTDFESRFPDKSLLIERELAHLPTNAFYKNNQGRIKYGGSIGKTCTHIAEGMPFLYRSVLTYFASAFESYLDAKVRPRLEKPNDRVRWGPYLRTLDIAELRESEYSLSVETLINADICRKMRNRVVHPPFNLPKDKTDRQITKIKDEIATLLFQGSWKVENIKSIVNSTVGQFFGDITSHITQSPTQPPELFYALFNFTGLDKLACEIEEALLPEDTSTEFWIWRKDTHVRRLSLKFEPPAGTSHYQTEEYDE